MLADEYLVNFDCMEPDELRRHAAILDQLAQSMPNKSVGDWATATTLAAYAKSKATAIEFRRQGMVRVALQWESLCEAEYGRIPGYAQW